MANHSNARPELAVDRRRAVVREAVDAVVVARYLADMTAQLESMAGAARLELLAYLLAMARAEAENLARTPPRE